jgi:periplasmic divalent cation tolerance protein
MSSTPVPDIVIVLTTIDSADRAGAVARTLIAERLAACVNVLPEMRSFYRWEGETKAEAEWQLLIKTTAARLEALKQRLHELHPYEVPEFLVLPVSGGSDSYLRWIAESTGPE